MEKQTAVQWLIQQLENNINGFSIAWKEEFERSLQMEREQIEEAWEKGTERNYDNFISGSDYYTQTFKP